MRELVADELAVVSGGTGSHCHDPCGCEKPEKPEKKKHKAGKDNGDEESDDDNGKMFSDLKEKIKAKWGSW
jgi:hypothetical protein